MPLFAGISQFMNGETLPIKGSESLVTKNWAFASLVQLVSLFSVRAAAAAADLARPQDAIDALCRPA